MYVSLYGMTFVFVFIGNNYNVDLWFLQMSPHNWGCQQSTLVDKLQLKSYKDIKKLNPI